MLAQRDNSNTTCWHRRTTPILHTGIEGQLQYYMLAQRDNSNTTYCHRWTTPILHAGTVGQLEYYMLAQRDNSNTTCWHRGTTPTLHAGEDSWMSFLQTNLKVQKTKLDAQPFIDYSHDWTKDAIELLQREILTYVRRVETPDRQMLLL